MRRHRLRLFCLFVLTAFIYPAGAPAAPGDRAAVLVISVDGLRPDVLLRAEAPSIRGLMAEGSFTFYAWTTSFANTLPSHTSMLTGVPPDTHGVTWNGDREADERQYPLVPTVLGLAKKHGLTAGFAAGKTKFVALAEPGTVNWSYVPSLTTVTDEKVADRAIDIIRHHHPDLMFVHFPGADSAGHAVGWGTRKQLTAIAMIDHQVGRVVRSFDSVRGRRRAYVMLSTDHGGYGKSHGPNNIESALIPFMIRGPGVRPDFDLTRTRASVHIEDIAVTALNLLEVPVPAHMTGHMVASAFQDDKLNAGAHYFEH